MSGVEETSTAQAPFDNHDCDIILRSTDGVNFHVFKLILSLVSPVFKDMFTLPQTDLQSHVPVIPVAESSTTLRSLLLLCYPAATPTFNKLDDVKAVMEAARKYDMEASLSRAGDLAMAQFLPTNSLELYALSCRFGWQHHAQTAAARTLEIKDLGRPSSVFTGLRDITGFDYHRLLVYHYECGVAAQAVVGSLSWLEPSSNHSLRMWSCPPETKAGRKLCIANLGDRVITPWFDEYLVSSGKELLARPCESTIWESESYDRAIFRAVGCSHCLSNGATIGNMSKFRTLFIAQVKQVLADVRIRDD
ncbi:hypothetical protein M405DRAFT_765634 [Rhizopogon salebrosus TDB-379]|nr:hypothetical protein M405DRAFT_765634 [Rhizopogon salebrosus TDB-379]